MNWSGAAYVLRGTHNHIRRGTGTDMPHLLHPVPLHSCGFALAGARVSRAFAGALLLIAGVAYAEEPRLIECDRATACELQLYIENDSVGMSS